jgi:hypothetical protein
MIRHDGSNDESGICPRICAILKLKKERKEGKIDI